MDDMSIGGADYFEDDEEEEEEKVDPKESKAGMLFMYKYYIFVCCYTRGWGWGALGQKVTGMLPRKPDPNVSTFPHNIVTICV